MHEVALARELLSLIREAGRAHAAARVTRARVEIGQLSCASPDALRFAFEALRVGTLADGCELVVERTPLRASCTSCGEALVADAKDPACPRCGRAPLEVLAGRELRLVSIEVEDG